MDDIRIKVRKALLKVVGEKNVFPAYPPKNTAFPCIVYNEINNAPRINADDGVYLSEVCYSVNIYGNGDELDMIAKKADKAMSRIGFLREFSHDLYTPDGDRYKVARYKKYIGDD